MNRKGRGGRQLIYGEGTIDKDRKYLTFENSQLKSGMSLVVPHLWDVEWSQTGSNRRPLECHSSALPTELWPHFFKLQITFLSQSFPTTFPISFGTLSQLSYGPNYFGREYYSIIVRIINLNILIFSYIFLQFIKS